MRRGFRYDTALCVNCKACSVACSLENGLQPGTRSVMVWNEMAHPWLPVLNLSLACNHCEEPACLTGCPANAYTQDESGAVIHHRERCMGCKYCTWRCPYDAPKVNLSEGYIEKCHFCYERAGEGIDPACVTACPTGAIKIVNEDRYPERDKEWFPETGMNPAVIIESHGMGDNLQIIPAEEMIETDNVNTGRPGERIMKEWSLAGFSLLVMLSAASVISSWFKENAYNGLVTLLMLIPAMILSFTHLGVKSRAWRAPLNVFRSPLSREIIAVSLLTASVASDYLAPGLLPVIVSPLLAILVLITVDLVYLGADRSAAILLHSGQVFFSGLLAASYFTGFTNAFLVFSVLAAGSIVLRYKSSSGDVLIRYLYLFRALSLPVVMMLLYFESKISVIMPTIIFVAGIIADRLLFFDDFRPVSIKETISENFNTKYEKERDKQCANTDIP